MKVLLLASGTNQTMQSAQFLRSRLIAAGIEACVQNLQEKKDLSVPVQELSLVVPMGGDGTFLAAAHMIDFAPIPLLGFNYGHLAFLSGSPERDEVELICDALCGDVVFERRATLDAHITCQDGSTKTQTALNELAFTRGMSGHMVDYKYSVNGTLIANVQADGIIASTATGSTAYALSAGGPIISPGYKGLMVVPVAPHTILSRALVLASSDVLELEFLGEYTNEASLFMDGQILNLESTPSHIMCQRGEKEVLFARGGGDFFQNVAATFFQGGGFQSGIQGAQGGGFQGNAAQGGFRGGTQGGVQNNQGSIYKN